MDTVPDDVIQLWDAVENNNLTTLKLVNSTNVISLLNNKQPNQNPDDNQLLHSRPFILSYYVQELTFEATTLNDLLRETLNNSNRFGFTTSDVGYSFQRLMDEYYDINDASFRANYLLKEFGEKMKIPNDTVVGVGRILISALLKIQSDIKIENVQKLLLQNQDFRTKVESHPDKEWFGIIMDNLDQHLKYKAFNETKLNNTSSPELSSGPFANHNYTYTINGTILDTAKNFLLNETKSSDTERDYSAAPSPSVSPSPSTSASPSSSASSSTTASTTEESSTSRSSSSSAIPSVTPSSTMDPNLRGNTSPSITSSPTPSSVPGTKFPSNLAEYHSKFVELAAEPEGFPLIKAFNDFFEGRITSSSEHGDGVSTSLYRLIQAFELEKSHTSENLRDNDNKDKAVLELRTLIIEAFCVVTGGSCNGQEELDQERNCILVSPKPGGDPTFRYSIDDTAINHTNLCLINKAPFKPGVGFDSPENFCYNESRFTTQTLKNGLISTASSSAEPSPLKIAEEMPLSSAVHFIVDFYAQLSGECLDV